MNSNVLNIEIQDFINKNLYSDLNSILLKGISFSSIEAKTVIEQIEAKKKSKIKLPSWFSAKNIYYPNKLNIEQTSSEITAKYKSELISGDTIIDLTGGYGDDCFYFSKQFKSVKHCEINESLSKIVNHNFKQLNISNIETILADGILYLEKNEQYFDWIYIDPSRRHDSKGKVFFLDDCLPNIPKHLDLLFNHSHNIMIKTSPLLDLSVGIEELKHVKTIHVIAVNNEVKELLWVLENNYFGEIRVKTINLKKDSKEIFEFNLNDEKRSETQFNSTLTYLYEPNAAILKAGAFNEVSKQLHVSKLHKHSHLYTSNNLVEFPGRVFKIQSVIFYNKKNLKSLTLSKANITTRNFPETVQQIRKKTKIKDGGDVYLFFTTDLNNQKTILITEKL